MYSWKAILIAVACNMEDRILPIREIESQTKRWTCQIQVIEKCYPRSSQGSRSFQKLILQDVEGTLIQATIFGRDIQLFERSIVSFKKYNVSNAFVRYIQPTYRVVENSYQWIINGATLIEEVESMQTYPIIKFNFTPFRELRSDSNHTSTVDIMAVVLQISPTRRISTPTGDAIIQELMLVTNEMRPTLLTTWEQFIENECGDISKVIDSRPIIVAKRLKVVNHNGTSLSTKSGSCIMINPEISEMKSLRSWCDTHKTELDTLILTANTQSSRASKSTPLATHILTAVEANDKDKMDTFWVNTTASITNFNQRFWYVGCSNCHKAIHIECGRAYTCLHCDQPSIAEARCRFDVQLTDASGSVTANCFGRHAEKLFTLTANELKENTNENGATAKEFLENKASTNSHLILLKPYNYQLGSASLKKLTIISIQDNSSECSTSTPT